MKRQPLKGLHQVLPWYVGNYTTRMCDIEFETAKKFLMQGDGIMVEKRRFERI